MKNLPKVIGVIQVRDEWPLLAVSISHALMNHVDEVYVLNHGSKDGSLQGLERLKKLWDNRLHVFNCYSERYWQEASTNALITISQASSTDWFYVFDADEFLLTRGSISLREILGGVDAKYSAIRYDVQNWISTDGFDETLLDRYSELRYRSVTNLCIEMHPTLYAEEIFWGYLNFFDIPFPSKVIFRNNESTWLKAGSHSISKPSDIDALSLPTDEVRAVHFPFLSRKKVERKVKHGERLIRDGFPATHGWQSQMIYRLAQESKLDEFWESHTITDHHDSNDRTLPTFVADEGFALAIEPVLCLLKDRLGSRALQRTEQEEDSSSRKVEDTGIPFRTVVHMTRKFQLMADSLHSERDALAAERDALAVERNVLLSSRSWRYTRFLRATRRYVTCGLCSGALKHLSVRSKP